jgi:hypothetical protein
MASTDPGGLPSIEDLTGRDPDVDPAELRVQVLHGMGLADPPPRPGYPDAPDTTYLRRELGL